MEGEVSSMSDSERDSKAIEEWAKEEERKERRREERQRKNKKGK